MPKLYIPMPDVCIGEYELPGTQEVLPATGEFLKLYEYELRNQLCGIYSKALLGEEQALIYGLGHYGSYPSNEANIRATERITMTSGAGN